MSQRGVKMFAALTVGVSLIGAAATDAQAKTYVVDEKMGAGAHFRSVTAALAKVTHGDRIIVRRGMYSYTSPVTKGVSIIGQGPAVAISGLRVRDVPAGRTVSIRNLTWNTYFPSSISVSRCKGTVVIDDCALQICSVSGSRNVLVSRCKVQNGFSADSSTLVISESTLTCHSRYYSMTVSSSSIALANCRVDGGQFILTNYAAIWMRDANSALTINGDGSRHITSKTRWPIVGKGLVIADPRTNTKSLVNPGITLIKKSMPYLSATGAPPGGLVKIRLAARAKDVFALAAALPAPPSLVPRFGGALWLDPQTMVLAHTGTLDANGTFNLDVRVPNAPELVGLAVAWQAVAGLAPGRLMFSNPAAYVHGL